MSRDSTRTFDGLVVGYGPHSVDNNVACDSAGGGVKRIQKLRVLLADVTTAATEANTPAQSAQIPRGSIITDAYVQTIVAAAGSSSTLDIGLWGRGSLATPVTDNADGIAENLTEARMSTVGEIISLKSDALAGIYLPQLDTGGTTVVGTPVGSVALDSCVISVEWDTAAFTAGEVEITVEYIPPSFNAVAAVAL